MTEPPETDLERRLHQALQQVLERYGPLEVLRRLEVKPLSSTLTPTQLHVLALAAHGETNKAIANKMGSTEHTVKTHFTNIFQRLKARDRANAVYIATREGWLPLAEPE